MGTSGVLVNLLKQRPLYCAVINRYAEPEASSYLRQLGYKELHGLPLVCYCSPPQPRVQPPPVMPPSPQNSNKLLYYYLMDIASLYPVLALNPSPNDSVLDMCAAPGGKAFAMLQMVKSEEGGALALNDTNMGRVKRLREVVQKCVAKSVMHSVRITRRRGEEWGGIEESEYDRVLVDAPCSSDRHSVTKWTAKSKGFWPDSEKFRTLQHSLLLSAFHAVKSGGVVVYSTCTMSTQENDAVVEGVLESACRRGYQVSTNPHLVFKLEGAQVEKTKFGNLIIPSVDLNIGPMYLSKLSVVSK